MDKRDLSLLFRERLKGLLSGHDGGLASFARSAGVDRSALNQLLADPTPRLPRAETLRRIAVAKGVTVDWLLGLSHATEGAKDITPSVEIETAFTADGTSSLDRWWQQSAGIKVRYVPANLPDMLRIPELSDYDIDSTRAPGRAAAGEIALSALRQGASDLEVAMPVQTLDDLAYGGSIWNGLAEDLRRRQLRHMAALTEELYPALRLHLFDGRVTFSAPFTVFGLVRVALYLGEDYLVLTAADQVKAMARTFDTLVRKASVGPDRVHLLLGNLANCAV